MESSQPCLTASEKALHSLDLFPVELQRTSEMLGGGEIYIKKKYLLLRQC